MKKISLINTLKKTFKSKNSTSKKKSIKKKTKLINKIKKGKTVIKPDECIDCGVCEPECPVDAIKADIEPGSEKWLEINKQYSEILSLIHI